MRNLIKLNDLTKQDIYCIWQIADDLQKGKYKNFLFEKTVVMFFPDSSIRTRVTFEKGVYLLGGQTILFPPQTLDKKEDLRDVTGYLNNWADVVIIRHSNIEVLEKIAEHSKAPIINAMTSINHPCEMLTDLYEISKRFDNFEELRYLYIGTNGNIGYAWKEISEVLGFELSQCCPKGYEVDGINVYNDLEAAVKGKNIICTDSIPKEFLQDFKGYQVDTNIMKKAEKGAILNLCPPFYRGEEVSDEVINSDYFVGYEFKKHLLEIEQAVLIYSLLN